MATQSSNLTAGFIDLASYDETERFLYGGKEAVSYFVRRVRKCTWFTVVPVILSKQGPSDWGQSFDAQVSRAGDYLLRSWLRVTIPSVEITNQALKDSGSNIRWTRNLMHNLLRECSISFNDLVEMRFDNYFLDFNYAFAVPAGKRNGYMNMIGTFPELCNPMRDCNPNDSVHADQIGQKLPESVLLLPLPICHSRDSGVALPTATLPYNEIKLRFNLRHWKDLLIVDQRDNSNDVSYESRPVGSNEVTIGALQVDVWADFALVSNEERREMGSNIRDILIEQVQTSSGTAFLANSGQFNIFDLRFTHSIKTIYFAVRNKTVASEWSNYTTHQGRVTSFGVCWNTNLHEDPIETVTLQYENTHRLSNMGSDYFSLIVPYYSAINIPLETGYHVISYSLDMMEVDPMGSTNFGKLANVSLLVRPSIRAVEQARTENQSFEMVIVAVNHNVVRIAGGALGFPVF